MDWVERWAAEERDRQAAETRIKEGVDHLWKNLCYALRASVEASNANLSDRSLEYSGDGLESVSVKRVNSAVTPALREVSRVEIGLDREKRTIRIAYRGKDQPLHGAPSNLELRLNDRREPAIFLDGREISAEKAAEELLSPLIFPKLWAAKRAEAKGPAPERE